MIQAGAAGVECAASAADVKLSRYTYITVEMRPQKSLTGNVGGMGGGEGVCARHLYLADTFECNAVIHQLNSAFIELPIHIGIGIGSSISSSSISKCKCKCYQVFGVR